MTQKETLHTSFEKGGRLLEKHKITIWFDTYLQIEPGFDYPAGQLNFLHFQSPRKKFFLGIT